MNYNNDIAGKIVRQLQFKGSGPVVTMPPFSGDGNMLLGTLTGNWELGYDNGIGCHKCEVELFNHTWDADGRPVRYSSILLPISTGFTSTAYYQLLGKITDVASGQISGMVFKDFSDRGARTVYRQGISYFPHFDPNYMDYQHSSYPLASTYCNTEYWDRFFNDYPHTNKYLSTALGLSVTWYNMLQLFLGYEYKEPRTTNAYLACSASAKSMTVELHPFWKGGYLKTKGVNLYTDEACTQLAFSRECQAADPLAGPTSWFSLTAFYDFGHVFYSWFENLLTINTQYYAKAYFVRYGNPLLGELETDEITYESDVVPAHTAETYATPEVIVGVALGITNTTITANFRLDFLGDIEIVEAGVCYGTSPNPTMANGKVTSSVRTSNTVERLTMTGLTKDTLYYFRAYAKTSDNNIVYSVPEWSYSAKTTNVIAQTIPVLYSVSSFLAVTDVQSQVTNAGGSAITARGFCYNSTGMPTIADAHVLTDAWNHIETAIFYGSIPVAAGTKMYVRAYATNATGTAYSPNNLAINAPALPIDVPTSPVISIQNATGVSNTTANLSGAISDLAGKTITSGGFRYRIVGGAWQNAFITGLSTTGAISKALTGLTKETDYQAEVYLLCGTDVYETSTVSFRTLADPIVAPIVTLDSVPTAKGSTTVSLKGTITSLNGNPAPSERGFIWALVGTPITAKITNQTVIGTDDSIANKFNGSVTGLTASTAYHAKAYIICGGVLTLSTSECVFTTNAVVTVVAPTVTTQPLTTPNATHNIISALITNNGTLTRKGIDISTSALSGNGEPSVDAKTVSGDSLSFGVAFDLQPETTYHARAFAENEEGLTWGNEITFTTPAVSAGLSVMTTANVVQHSSVNVGIAVTGGDSTKNGVVYSETNPTPTHLDSVSECALLTTKTLYFYKVGTYNIRAFATNANGIAYGNVVTVVVDSISDSPLGFPRFPYVGLTWNLGGITYVWNGYAWQKKTSEKAEKILVTNGVYTA